MKLRLNTANNSRYKMRLADSQNQIARDKYPKNSEPSFTSLKFTYRLTDSQISSLAGEISELLGDKRYFEKLVRKVFPNSVNPYEKLLVGFGSSKDNIKDGMLSSLYALVSVPMKVARKVAPESKTINKFFEAKESLAAKEKLIDLLDVYKKSAEKAGGKLSKNQTVADSTALTDAIFTNFKNATKENITKVYKGYATRDERTLNRAATSLVSAFFGMTDRYNTNIVETDDREDAIIAGNARFKQEVTRMLFNAASTYLTLGVLNRFIKNSVLLNAFAIGFSALLVEVGSRLKNNIPIKRMTPQDAKEYNKKYPRKHKLKEQKIIKTNYNAIYSAPSAFDVFKNTDGTFTSLSLLKNSKKRTVELDKIEEPQKKKMSLKTLIGTSILGLTAVASIISILKNAGAGNKKLNVDAVKISENISPALQEVAKKIRKFAKIPVVDKAFQYTKGTNKAIRDFFTISTGNLSKTELVKYRSRIANLISENNPKLKNNAVLKDHLAAIDSLINDPDFVSLQLEKTSWYSGFYNGITKVFKLFHDVFSSPGDAISKKLFKIEKKSISTSKFISIMLSLFKKYDEKDVAKVVYKKNITKYIDKLTNGKYGASTDYLRASIPTVGRSIKSSVVSNLERIGLKFKKPDASTMTVDQKVTEAFLQKIRIFDNAGEAGTIANAGRALVTLIGSWFYINDYRNNALIDSNGENIKAAEEQQRIRLGQKLVNFIVNGTIMNIGNSLFMKPLNANLIAATAIATGEELTNETLVRKIIGEPLKKMPSKKAVSDYEEKQTKKGGFAGAFRRAYMKLTGKKTILEKAGLK